MGPAGRVGVAVVAAGGKRGIAHGILAEKRNDRADRNSNFMLNAIRLGSIMARCMYLYP